MLELIVLGEVPGTNIVISFPEAVAIATIVLGSILIRAVARRQPMQTKNIEEITI